MKVQWKRIRLTSPGASRSHSRKKSQKHSPLSKRASPNRHANCIKPYISPRVSAEDPLKTARQVSNEKLQSTSRKRPDTGQGGRKSPQRRLSMKKVSKRQSFSPTHSPPNSDIINVQVTEPPAIIQSASGE